MHFYKVPHRFYCGVDLHTRSMFLCVQDHDGKKLLHQDYPADPQRFLQAIAPYRDDLVVGCECTFSWHWLVLMIRESDQAKCFVHRLEAKHGKPHALAVLRARIGRAVYFMLKRKGGEYLEMELTEKTPYTNK